METLSLSPLLHLPTFPRYTFPSNPIPLSYLSSLHSSSPPPPLSYLPHLTNPFTSLPPPVSPPGQSLWRRPYFSGGTTLSSYTKLILFTSQYLHCILLLLLPCLPRRPYNSPLASPPPSIFFISCIPLILPSPLHLVILVSSSAKTLETVCKHKQIKIGTNFQVIYINTKREIETYKGIIVRLKLSINKLFWKSYKKWEKNN